MKTASFPSLRVSPQLRQDTEAVLLEGESLSQFIESAVRGQVALRKAQAEFLARGLASRDRARAHGRYVAADEVLGKLRASLQAAQVRRGERA
ncbi:YlcI/YnfO family protein [Ottowia sp.]|uniref:YlcI/YnfO family protein n=1 Tax=Ottowia sp. TaxID=1898956 RepID=UPI0039E5C8E4